MSEIVALLQSIAPVVSRTILQQMSQVAIFGDIHGNLPALEAVLADIDANRLSPLYCLGDLVGYGTFPDEVIETIRKRNIPTLMGNYDQGVGNNSDDCACGRRCCQCT